jgi:hypothetical protein
MPRAELEPIDALRELVRQIDLSNALDDHGHELKNLRALADAKHVIERYDEPPDPPGWEGGFSSNH